jgi:FkbM family methyltransferase
VSTKTLATMADFRTAFREGRIDKLTYATALQGYHQALFEHAGYLAESDVAEIRIRRDEVVIVSTSGIQLVADPDDAHLMPNTLLNFGGHECDVQQMALRLAADVETVIDVGANVGWYSIQFSRSEATRTVYAFEPVSKTCGLLQRNLELNGVDKVRVFKMGLADSDGERSFHYTDKCSGATSMEAIPHLPDQEILRCPVTTLDLFAQHHDLGPGFIKCDVEGAELLVMRGAIETLKRHRPALLLEMLRKWAKKFDYHPNDIIHLLAGLGYACFTADGATLRRFETMADETVETNFFFLHEEAHGAALVDLVADTN